jgi:hypothetical protein
VRPFGNGKRSGQWLLSREGTNASLGNIRTSHVVFPSTTNCLLLIITITLIHILISFRYSFHAHIPLLCGS